MKKGRSTDDKFSLKIDFLINNLTKHNYLVFKKNVQVLTLNNIISIIRVSKLSECCYLSCCPALLVYCVWSMKKLSLFNVSYSSLRAPAAVTQTEDTRGDIILSDATNSTVEG